MSIRGAAAMAGFALAWAVAGLSAQEPLPGAPGDGAAALVEVVDRSNDQRVASARVVLVPVNGPESERWEGETNVEGLLITPLLRLGSWEIEVQALGYEILVDRVTFEASGDHDLRVALVPEALALEPVVAAVRRQTRLERQGFYERRMLANGYFLTRQDIEQRSMNRISDVFRTVPGARVVPPGLNESAALIVLRNDCIPLVVIDGAPASGQLRLDDLFHPSDIEAIEVYHGASGPVQFSPFTTCGTIMVWTRETSLLEGRAFTWGRLVLGGVILGILFLISR